LLNLSNVSLPQGKTFDISPFGGIVFHITIEDAIRRLSQFPFDSEIRGYDGKQEMPVQISETENC